MAARKKAAAKPSVIETPVWSFIAFTDIHVKADTIERVLEVLKRVRGLCVEHNASAVFLGDFWDVRGVLPVRQMDQLATEFDRWHAQNLRFYAIPGNHDQVTKDGMVHGLRWLAAYPNIVVCTEPVLLEEEGVAFLPWREDGEEQAQLFEALAGTDSTIFGHAEVQGAMSNTGHRAPGRVTLAEVEAASRAAYFGHYHQRQKLGRSTYYLGSPFEHTTGERNMPHGVALITNLTVEPTWIDFADFPQHRRFIVRVAERRMDDVDGRKDAVRAQDIVEVQWPFGTPEDVLKKALAAVPAHDVRPVPIPEERAPEETPEFALTLDGAVVAYVEQETEEHDPLRVELVDFGNAILSEVGATSVQPLCTSVELLSIHTRDFCQIRGVINLDVSGGGLFLLRGPQAIGKTSFVDSITWCLYGTTSPRKAASVTASLKGDEIINDYSDDCRVQLFFDVVLAGSTGEKRRISIERTKKRGEGDRVKIEGLPEADGVRDQQERIDRIIGLSYPMWRAACSLGQGDVGSFVTGADKSRKELLSAAYGFDAVADGLKLVRNRLQACNKTLERNRNELAKEEGSLNELGGQDFTREAQQWAAQRTAEQSRIAHEIQQAEASRAECVAHLANEGQWVELRARNEARVQELQAQLAGLPQESRMTQLQRELGAQQLELSNAEATVNTKREHLRQAMAARAQGMVPCRECGRPFDPQQVDAHVQKLEQELSQAQFQHQTAVTRVSNTQQAIGELQGTGGAQREGLLAQLAEVQQVLKQTQQATERFAALKVNRDAADQRIAQLRADLERLNAQANPFEGRQQETAQRRAAAEARVRELQAVVAQRAHEKNKLEFWEQGFSQGGLPVLMLRTSLFELENAANTYLRELTEGECFVRVTMTEDDLDCTFMKCENKMLRERRFDQLSGGERQCAKLSFSPFGLAGLFRARGVQAPLLNIDELTTHLGAMQKNIACDLLRRLDRKLIIVIDHDVSVQGEFDTVLDMVPTDDGGVKFVRQ